MNFRSLSTQVIPGGVSKTKSPGYWHHYLKEVRPSVIDISIKTSHLIDDLLHKKWPTANQTIDIAFLDFALEKFCNFRPSYKYLKISSLPENPKSKPQMRTSDLLVQIYPR
ncbi:hypothetical protein CBL_01958 [Carabus blaptoides fortunei]